MMYKPAIQRYFEEKGCPYWHEYERQYSPIDFVEFSVTIIGGDCGSACLYAILRGANQCIMYERDPELRKKAQEVFALFGIKDKVEIRGEWNGMEYPDTSIFLIDCEGCESLLDVDLVSRKYPQVGIAVHSWTENRVEILQKLAEWHYALTYVTPDGQELYFVRVR